MKVKRYLVGYKSEVAGVNMVGITWVPNISYWVSYGAMQHLLAQVYNEVPWWELLDEKEVELEEPDDAMLTAFKFGLMEDGTDVPYPDDFVENLEYVPEEKPEEAAVEVEPEGIVAHAVEVPPPVEDAGEERFPHREPQVLQEEK